MKKTVVKGICQTLILMIALFLIGVQILQFLEVALNAYEAGNISQENLEALSIGTETDEPKDVSMNDWITRTLKENNRLAGFIYAGMFTLISLTLLTDHPAREEKKSSLRLINLTIAGLYLGCGIPFLITGYTEEAVMAMTILYTVILFAETGIRLRTEHKPRQVITRVLLLIMAVLNLIFLKVVPWFVLVLIALRAFRQILVISFSQIQLDVLRKIIRKTYAYQILFGMVLLMVAFSLLLTMLDPGFPDFFDALWFCFATVTTIGYGDVTAMTGMGRALSAILGVYGIVVVALITSIIVNFYNEMKAEGKDEQAESQEHSP